MKWLKIMMITLAAFLVLNAGSFAQDTQKAYTVETFIGKCEYKTSKGTWKVIQMGEKIPADADIRMMNPSDSLELKAPDGSIISISGQNSKKLSAILREQNQTVQSSVQPDKEVVPTQTGNSLTVGLITGNCEFRIGKGNWKGLQSGDTVAESAEVRVNGKKDSVELVFPDSSSVMLMGMSSVKVGDIYKQKSAKKSSSIALLAGKLFAKVKPASDIEFKVETETAVAAVRGTKFGVSFMPGQGGNVLVSEGLVAVGDPAGKFAPVALQPGFMSSLPAQLGLPPAAPQPAPVDLIKQFDPNYNGGQEQTAPQPKDTLPVPTPSPAPVQDQKSSGLPKKSDDCSSQGGWSVSAENIGGVVWNKVLVSPTFRFGSFAFGLYIPVYFQSMDDLFTPSSWYNYQEWNFGSPLDALHDLLLKIRFVEFQTDMLLFKLGSIPDMTVGHGSLVDAYANDTFFPSIRKVGLQWNMDFGVFGMETLVGDVFAPNLFGARIFARPAYGAAFIGNLGFGVSGFIDTDPLTNGQGKVFGYSFDLDLPVVKIPLIFNATLYSDIATLGFSDTAFNTNQLMKGYGVFAGLKGNIAVIDYRAEYRYIQGGFIPNYVDKFYDSQRANNYLRLLTTTPLDYNGFLVSAGTEFSGVGSAILSYEQLFSTTGDTNIRNTLHMEANISKCLFKKAYGTIAYDRKDFGVNALFSSFLGNGTMVTTKFYYEVADGAYVGVTYKKFYQADSTGAIVESSTVALETQMGL